MKKLTAFLTAAALLGTMCACEDKHSESEPVGDVTAPAVTETAPEPTTEPAFLELTEADFEPVDMKLDITDTEPPLDIHEVDLSTLDFGERMSPCKADGVYESYTSNPYADVNDEWSRDFEEELHKRLETPCTGILENAAFADGKYYMWVNFDDLCGCHDSSIYSYDVKTGELKELVRHTGLEYYTTYFYLVYAHGRLYYPLTCYVDEEGNKAPFTGYNSRDGSIVYRIDDSTLTMKRETTLYSIDISGGEETEECTFKGMVGLMNETENGLFIYRYAGGDVGANNLEYNITTKELSELDESDPMVVAASPAEYYCDGEPAEVTGGLNDEGKYEPVTIKTQYYTLETELIRYSDIYLWKDMVCIIYTEYVGTEWLYTYDIKNHERLKMRTDGFGYGNALLLKEGLMLINGSLDGFSNQLGERLYYVVPRLGTFYRMQSSESFMLGNTTDTVYYVTMRARADEYVNSYNLYGGSGHNMSLPDKLYWFEI